MTTHPVEVRFRGRDAGLFAARPLACGAPVTKVDGVLRSCPGRYSLQVAESAHLHPVLPGDRPKDDPSQRWSFANHGCVPNLRVEVGERQLAALRPIEAGEELVFDYNTTEWDLAEPFACRCGAATCYGTVRGFRHLPPARQDALLHWAAPHIRRLRPDI